MADTREQAIKIIQADPEKAKAMMKKKREAEKAEKQKK